MGSIADGDRGMAPGRLAERGVDHDLVVQGVSALDDDALLDPAM